MRNLMNGMMGSHIYLFYHIARHKRIETTLRYNQISDKKATKVFNRLEKKPLNLETLTPEDKAKVWLDKLLAGEIDLKTFKTGMDVLMPDRKQKGDDVGYV